MLFISHSTLDKEHAVELQGRLQDRGYACEQRFLDSDPRSGIKLGEKWEKAIYDNLRDCRALLVLCSPNWLLSRWCFAELAAAKMRGIAIFPIVIADCDRNSLGEFQAVFLNQTDAKRREEEFERLFHDLEGKGFGPRDHLVWPNPELKDANGRIDNCPFPGLPAFDERYAAVYFGREPEKAALLQELRAMRTIGEPRFLMIVGGSGSGKSSLLMAGVLPPLKHGTSSAEWQVLSTLRFSRRTSENALFETLADDIVSRYPGDVVARGYPIPDRLSLVQQLAQINSEKAAKAFHDASRQLAIVRGRNEATTLLAIDQFEEFLAESAGPQAEKFLKFLKHLCRGRDDRLLVLGTMRSDYLDVYQNHPQTILSPSFQEWRIKPFQSDQIERTITEPAARARISFDPTLVARLRADAPTVDALPLLAFTLEKLFRRYSNHKVISLDDYNNLGGMQGSIRSSAEDLFDPKNQPPAIVAAVRMAFVKHLAEPNEKDDFVRLSARWDEINPLARPILDGFVTHRLLAKMKPDGMVLLEVAHEAIFRCWPLLTRWLSESADILRWRRDIIRDRRSAKANGQKWRLSGTQFELAKKWPQSRREELTPEEVGWIKAIAIQRFWIRVGLVSVAAIIAASAGVAWSEKVTADRAVVVAGQKQRLAESLRLVTESNASFDRTPITSLLLAVEAARATGPDAPPPQAHELLIERLHVVGGRKIASLGEKMRSASLGGEKRSVELLAKYDQLLTRLNPDVLHVWDLKNPLSRPFEVPNKMIHAVAPNGERLVTLLSDDTALVYDLKNLGARPTEIPGKINAIAFAPDGRIVTGEQDGFARIREINEPRKILMELGPHEGALYLLAFASNGRLATAGAGGIVRVWDLKSPRGPLCELSGHHEGVFSIQFNRAGKLVTTDYDYNAFVWDLSDPMMPKRTHFGDMGTAQTVVLGPDTQLATRDLTDRLCVWDIEDPNGDGMYEALRGFTYHMAFAPNGHLVADAGSNELYVWDLDKKADRPLRLSRHKGRITLLSNCLEEKLVSADAYGKACVWDFSDDEPTAIELVGHNGPVEFALATPEGNLLTVDNEGNVRRWDLDSPSFLPLTPS